ncbi:MAG: redoxin domain-containing protein [Planctomycetaceae bacterium]
MWNCVFGVQRSWVGVLCVALSAGTAFAADAPSVKTALTFKPVQKNVLYDIPEPDKYAQCQVKVERRGNTSGWVVFGEVGQTLRRYIDTNGDNVVDQWRYYQNGIEVYRDQDSNFNSKVDQSRWVNTAGSRWGIDRNEDGKIDAWKILSAEEATQEALHFLVTADAESLSSLMLTQDEIRSLKLSNEISAKLTEQVKVSEKLLSDAVGSSKNLTPQSKWLRFDGSFPRVIPADDEKTGTEIMLYQNVLAIVETDGKQVFVRFGDLIRVGDVWKLTQIPQPLEGNSIEVAESSLLMLPAVSASIASPSTAGLSAEMQGLLEQLQKLDQESPTPASSRADLSKYNARRVELLRQIIAKSTTDEERQQWLRQLIDGLTAAAQSGAFPEAVPQMKKLEQDLRKDKNAGKLVSYLVFRINLADYYSDLQQGASTEKLAEAQTRWLGILEDFIKKYPDAEDVPEAELQLAVAHEFSGKLDEAVTWYNRLQTDHPDSAPGKRAAGAVRRINLKGQPFELSGSTLKGEKLSSTQFQGAMLLVIYWATWCQPCTEDLPQLQALYEKHRSQGFEILGINLDTEPELIAPYLKEHRVNWAQLFEPGGLESPLAAQYGVMSLPTMILIGRDGKVVDRGISIGDLKSSLPDLLKAK